MNIITISGVYENSRRVCQMLGADHLAQQLRNIADDPNKLIELRLALNALESHSRVMGLDELSVQVR